MKGLREAFYPPARSPTPPSAHSSDHSPNRPNIDRSDPPTRGDDEDEDEIRVPSPRRQPLFTPLDLEAGDEDGPDMDELMAMEEMEREVHADAARKEGGEGANKVDDVPVLEAEDEWEGLYD
jgi:replication fork protection complex subunit Csm3/Swi3